MISVPIHVAIKVTASVLLATSFHPCALQTDCFTIAIQGWSAADGPWAKTLTYRVGRYAPRREAKALAALINRDGLLVATTRGSVVILTRNL